MPVLMTGELVFIPEYAILSLWKVKTGDSLEKPLALYLLIWVNCRLEA